jgi:hypothetical protein
LRHMASHRHRLMRVRPDSADSSQQQKVMNDQSCRSQPGDHLSC